MPLNGKGKSILGIRIPDDGLERAIREGSAEAWREGLSRLLREGEEEWIADSRDLMLALAPYHDCARRIDLDPPIEFALAAEGRPVSIAKTVREFGERTDINPETFYYALVEGPDGPSYHVLNWR